MRRHRLTWVLLAVLCVGIAAPAFAHHQPEFSKLRKKVRNLRDRVTALEQKPPTQGPPGQDGVSGYQVFTVQQDFGPGGIGGSWCGAPNANTTDQGWAVVGGGAELTPADVDKGFAIAGSWPNLDDPLNPGWSIQLSKLAGQDPGNVTLYAVCVKTAE